MQSLWDLFVAFFRAANLAFGGGPAIIPLVQNEVVNHYHWLSISQMADGIAISSALPGPIATLLAGFVGYHVSGWFGVLVALLGTVVPTTLIVILLSNILMKHINSPSLKGMLKAVRPVVVVLIAKASLDMGINSFLNIYTWTIAVITAIAVIKYKIHPAFLIMFSMVFGLVVFR
ncbi:MAG: putative chromate transport protein [Candidatus Dichloromethanomonas elyunquensis]|nr:MAG: putative chromate transport protein [Candidatus Dichloromethanomonas elyunquensis]